MQFFSLPAKRRVDALFFAHAVFSAVAGSLAFLFPHLFEWFMVHHGEKLALRDNADPQQKVAHLITRLYGAVILATFWITWSVRKTEDAWMRRRVIQAYAVMLGLTTLAMLRAQITEGADGVLNGWNWINILIFGALSLGYAWFAIKEPVAVFQGLGKSNV